MKNVFLLSAFIGLPGLLFHADAQGAFPANGRRINIDSFNTQVNFIMKEVGVPGLSLAIINDNRVVFYNTYGYKELKKKETVDKETIFEACSLSKSFLVFAALRLADEGKLDLDKPMYQYLPYEPLEHDQRYKLITPRMILSHSSGIENWKKENNPDTLEIISEPGKKFIYSGEGYQYLAKVMALISHQPYEVYIQEMVFGPLNLKRTFCQYSNGGAYPINYATGYDDFGNAYDKTKNLTPVPASGVHTTALDYATLIVSLFDKTHLTSGRVQNIMTPMVRLSDENPALHYGLGFELFFGPTDTLVSHGGNNSGFKAQIFYSVTNKCGIIFLSNGDLGKLVAKRLNEMSVALNIDPFYHDDFYEQYPCNALTLLKIYRDKDSAAMISKLDELKKATGGKIGMNTLNQLADILASGGQIQLAKSLVEDNTRLYPASSEAFYLLGEINLYLKEYKEAYTCLRKAKDLNYNDDPGIDYDIKKTAQMIGAQ